MRCDDPPIFARGRTDCPRYAAGRGLRGLAAARLSSASMPGGGGSRHQAIRQEPHRAHAPSRPRSLAQRRLPLGARGRAARPEKPSEIRGPSRPRPRSWPRTPIGRRSPHRRGLRHARGQDHLRSEPCQPKSPKPRKTHLLKGGESLGGARLKPASIVGGGGRGERARRPVQTTLGATVDHLANPIGRRGRRRRHPPARRPPSWADRDRVGQVVGYRSAASASSPRAEVSRRSTCRCSAPAPATPRRTTIRQVVAPDDVSQRISRERLGISPDVPEMIP